MGYRSDVAIAIHNKAKALSVIKGNWPSILCEEDAEDVREYEEYAVFYYSNIKWYSSYSNVIEVEDFFDFLREVEADSARELYGFLRIGESCEDIESDGDTNEYELHLNRSIDY